MANICLNDVFFYSDTNPEGLSDLWYDLEKSIIICPQAELSWIGNLFEYKGIDANGICLRGDVRYMERNDNNILLSVDSALNPLYDAYTAIARSYDVSFVMLSIEPGEKIYYNTDDSGTFFPDRYLIKFEDDSFLTPSGIPVGEELEDGETFTSVEYMLQRFTKLGYPADTVQELMQKLNDQITIHEFTNPYLQNKPVA